MGKEKLSRDDHVEPTASGPSPLHSSIQSWERAVAEAWGGMMYVWLCVAVRGCVGMGFAI